MKFKRYCNECRRYYKGYGEKFCSRKCYLSYWLKNKLWERKVVLICKYCNKKFEVIPYFKDRRKYCSIPCKNKAYTRTKDKKFCRKKTSLIQRYYNIRSRARKLDIFICDKKDFIKWYKESPKLCEYCGISPELWDEYYRGFQNKWSLSIDRMDNNRGYLLNNITLACGKCNAIKSNIFTYQEMKEIGERYIKSKWQKRLLEVKNENFKMV